MDETSDHRPRLWEALLDRSAEDVAAGRIVPLEPVLDRLRASIARMEARNRKKHGSSPEK